MSAWNTVVTIALANADQQLGIAGLNTAYAALFGSGGAGSSELSKDLSTIISALQKVQDELSEIDKNMQTILDDLTTLGFEIDAAAAVPVCAQINAYFESIQNLAQTPMKTQEDVQEFALTVLERAGPLANGENSIFNLLTQLNQFLIDGSTTEGPIIEKCATTNSDKDFLSFYAVMMGTAVGYATVLHKGVAVLNWLSAVNENRVQITNNALDACIGNQVPPVFAYADVAQSIDDANTYIGNLISAFNKIVPSNAQAIVQALGAKGDEAVSVDCPYYGKHGVSVFLSSYGTSKQYLVQMIGGKNPGGSVLWSPVKFDGPQSGSMQVDLVPTADLSGVGPDSQIPFALVVGTNLNASNKTAYLTNLSSGNNAFTGSDNKKEKEPIYALIAIDLVNPTDQKYELYTTPPKFLLFMNSNGTFNLQFYQYGPQPGWNPPPSEPNWIANPDKINTALSYSPNSTAYDGETANLGTFVKEVDRTDSSQWFCLELPSSG